MLDLNSITIFLNYFHIPLSVFVFLFYIQGTVKDNILVQESILMIQMRHVNITSLKHRVSNGKMLICSC